MTGSSSHAMAVIKRWSSAASWAIEARHGACATFCMMFALCLQRPSFANGRCVEHVAPRIWKVTTTYGTSTQKVSLFEDDAIESLLKVIGDTEGLPFPVYPKTPCRSNEADVWAHSYASRRHHRGVKNFAAFVADFGLDVQSPMDIYKIGLHTYWQAFRIREVESEELLASQLGRPSRPPWAPPVATHNCYIGELSIRDGNTIFIKTEAPTHRRN